MITRKDGLKMALYLFGVFVLPVAGYYATLYSLAVPSADFYGSALGAWVMALMMPTFHRVAKKPVIVWQVMLTAALMPILGFIVHVAEHPSLLSVHLSRLCVDLALTPIFVHYGLRVGRHFAEANRKTPVQPEAPRNLIHRISPETQPEDVVNVSQK